MLELEALENSILSLENSIEVYKRILGDNKSDKKLIDALRSGVI